MDNPRILTISDCRECPFMRRVGKKFSAIHGEAEIRCGAQHRIIGCRLAKETVPIPNWCPLVEADETFDARVIAATEAARKEASDGQS